jgi:hypothetical protein
VSVECPRCGETTGASRWCQTCGKDLSGGPPPLPTPESIDASRREAAWLQDHPEVAEAEWSDFERRERAQAALEEGGRAQATVGHEVARDPSPHARVARWSLFACAAIGVVTLALEAWHLSVIADVPDGSFYTSRELDDSNVRLGIAYIVQFLLLLGTAVAFIVWLYRVYSNLKPLGAYELRHGKGWAIGGWFVPILALWRPKQIVNDAWRASDPQLGFWAHRREWEDAAVPWLFLLWWLLFLVQSGVNRATGSMYDNATTLDAERSAVIVAACGSVLWIVTALLAVLVVDRITARQAERAAARERMAAAGDYAAAATPSDRAHDSIE